MSSAVYYTRDRRVHRADTGVSVPSWALVIPLLCPKCRRPMPAGTVITLRNYGKKHRKSYPTCPTCAPYIIQ